MLEKLSGVKVKKEKFNQHVYFNSNLYRLKSQIKLRAQNIVGEKNNLDTRLSFVNIKNQSGIQTSSAASTNIKLQPIRETKGNNKFASIIVEKNTDMEYDFTDKTQKLLNKYSNNLLNEPTFVMDPLIIQNSLEERNKKIKTPAVN